MNQERIIDAYATNGMCREWYIKNKPNSIHRRWWHKYIFYKKYIYPKYTSRWVKE